jgi:hypothetical protein
VLLKLPGTGCRRHVAVRSRLAATACRRLRFYIHSPKPYCFLPATLQGQVVYERFYEQFSEGEKGEIRGAFDAVAGPSSAAASAGAVQDGMELVGRFRRAYCHLQGSCYACGMGCKRLPSLKSDRTS